MTHILIPIKDIEELIAELKKKSNNWCGGQQVLLENILKEYKQISLNEKDIKDNSKIAAVNYNKFENSSELDKYTTDYEQAIKDLL